MADGIYDSTPRGNEKAFVTKRSSLRVRNDANFAKLLILWYLKHAACVIIPATQARIGRMIWVLSMMCTRLLLEWDGREVQALGEKWGRWQFVAVFSWLAWERPHKKSRRRTYVIRHSTMTDSRVLRLALSCLICTKRIEHLRNAGLSLFKRNKEEITNQPN